MGAQTRSVEQTVCYLAGGSVHNVFRWPVIAKRAEHCASDAKSGFQSSGPPLNAPAVSHAFRFVFMRAPLPADDVDGVGRER